ncbi:hypothetical protein KV205_11670 [Streptomyces sp. SKN60]|uniref:hypothetical protein n=1 Tax=Streptomyces sp. SKN60 TaxID=2855506 RepID=UPI0022476C7C|nr:hypothetical protein [Streptomyces sp. SKN60]MCX2181184.1 hypothetical protein [Streptomyces sp. SKN60]
MNEDEPVFKKSRWGSNRYVYNPNNPIGLALIIASSVFAIVMLLLMENRAGPFAPAPTPTWSPPSSEDVWPYPSTTP